MNWILDEERGCITDNAEPILEASFNDVKSKTALKLASKAPEMLELLTESLDTFTCNDSSDCDLKSRIEQLIQSATTI